MPVTVSGFVLAGGRSSRMGRDKALLELAGKPLVEHAVIKLGRLCGDVRILSSEPALAAYAPLVPDLHTNCGPMGGVEAALMESATDWNLILPVDVPFLPTRFLKDWLGWTLVGPVRSFRVSMLTVDDVAHPALLLIHREMRPFLSDLLDRGRYRLLTALEYGASEIAKREGLEVGDVFFRPEFKPQAGGVRTSFVGETREERGSKKVSLDAECDLWFANLNTPGEFSEAEMRAAALDT